MNKNNISWLYLLAYIFHGLGNRLNVSALAFISIIPLLYVSARYIISIYKKEGIINWKDWLIWAFFSSVIAFDIIYTYIIN